MYPLQLTSIFDPTNYRKLSMKILSVTALLCLSLTSSAQTTYQFLNQPFNAKYAMAASNSYLFYSDAESYIANPSLLGYSQSDQFGVSYTSHITDIKIGSSYFVRDFESIGKMGFSVQYVNYGTFVRADEFANKSGTFGAYDLVVGSSYAYDLGDSLLLGVTGKFISSSYESYSSAGIAADFGIHYVYSPFQVVLGSTLKNVGTQLSSYRIKEDLPLRWNIGFSKTLLRLPLTFGAEVIGLNEWFKYKDSFSKYLSLSTRFKTSKNLTIYASSNLRQRQDLDAKGGFDLTGLNLGGILNWDIYQFGYAYSDYGVIGAIHRVDFSFNLTKLKF